MEKERKSAAPAWGRRTKRKGSGKMERTQIESYIGKLCAQAGENEEFYRSFCENLFADEGICRELVYYMENGTFACREKVEGYTVVDVMIWQIDHFKAWLDRDTSGTGSNSGRMLLLAFDTLLKMKKDPAQYVLKMQSETGTDYEGKFK